MLYTPTCGGGRLIRSERLEVSSAVGVCTFQSYRGLWYAPPAPISSCSSYPFPWGISHNCRRCTYFPKFQRARAGPRSSRLYRGYSRIKTRTVLGSYGRAVPKGIDRTTPGAFHASQNSPSSDPSSSSSSETSSEGGHENGVPPGEGHPHLPRERDYFIETKITSISNPARGLLHFRG